LFIYASANRDEQRFENADSFDIFRENRGDLSFGVGAHFCLGAHLARAIGEMLIAKVIDNVSDYTVIEDQCERAYGEHLNGFVRMTIEPNWK
jgi:cytochrome P450